MEIDSSMVVKGIQQQDMVPQINTRKVLPRQTSHALFVKLKAKMLKLIIICSGEELLGKFLKQCWSPAAFAISNLL